MHVSNSLQPCEQANSEELDKTVKIQINQQKLADHTLLIVQVDRYTF